MGKRKKFNKVNSSSLDDGGIRVGRVAPAFSLINQHGKTRRLSDYRGKWVVLYFYPKDNTSGCSSQACQFSEGLARFKRNGAVVVGVSPDGQVSHQSFAGKFNLRFDLLVDEDKQVLEKYGVWREKSMYGRKYMGVVRTTYLLDPEGIAAFRWDKVKVPGHAEDVMKKIKALKS